jgi:hypothetical protein
MKTKTTILVALQLLLVFELSAQSNEIAGEKITNDSLIAQKEKFSLSGYAEVNYYRHYLWRGALWGSNDVSQPELHLDYRNFWLAFYTNLNLRPRNLSMEYYKQKTVFDEQDFELGYQNQIGDLEYEVSLAGYFYFYQLESPNTGEFCVNLKYPVWKNTKVFTESAADVAAYRGAFYSSIGLVYEKEIKNFALEGKVYGGIANSKFNNVYYGVDGTKLDFVGASVNLQYSLPNNLYVAVNGEYNQYTVNELKTVTGIKKTDNFSIHFGIEF